MGPGSKVMIYPLRQDQRDGPGKAIIVDAKQPRQEKEKASNIRCPRPSLQ
jgi:hypothetical protein